MSGSDVGRDGAGTTADRIRLVMTAGRDRELLTEWLRGLHAYEVSVGDPAAGLPADPDYDLCVVDAAALAAVGERLRSHRPDADRAVLPCLLVESESVADRDGAGAPLVPETDADLVTDSVSLPTDKTTLRRRIEHLLRSRRTVLELRARERQYERLVDSTPEALLVVRDGAVVYANSTAEAVFDADGSEDLDGRRIETLVAADGRSDLAAIRSTGDAGGFRELAMETLSGARLVTEVSGVEVTFDGGPALQLLVRDVTDEHERKQRLDLFDRAIQTASQGVSIADARQPDNPLIYVNETFEEITGYSAGEVLGENCRFLQGEHTDEATVARLRTAIDAGEPVSVDVRNYRKDGTPFWNRVDVMPVTGEDGEVTHFLGLQADVTDEKASEERLQVLSRVLRHNLRNSMTVVQGYAQDLAASDDPETAAAAERITAEARDLLRVSERIQEFNSIVSTAADTVEPHDVTEILRTAVERLREEYPDTAIELDGVEGAVASGHELLPAALGEFLAVPMYSDAPGEVTVTVRADDDWVTVELVDEGRTTAAHDLRAIEQNAETAVDHPDGVGLWLVRWAVQYSDGELAVIREDHPTIHLRLPRARED